MRFWMHRYGLSNCLARFFPVFAMGWWWIVGRAPTRQDQLDALKDATRLGELMSAKRLLVIRAIDDEASLALALGAIVNFVTARFATYIVYISFTGPIILFSFKYNLVPVEAQTVATWAYFATAVGFVILIPMLLGGLMVSRLVHGSELATSPMECQINTQSAPDAVDLSQIVTLVSHNYVKSLRHGIYAHENCAKAISDWVRSQLDALHVR
jgi:hypothetical protein